MSNDMTLGINLVPKVDSSNIASSVNQIQAQFNKLKLPKDMAKNLTSAFDQFQKDLNAYQSKALSPPKTKSNVTELEKYSKQVLKDYQDILDVINKISTTDVKIDFDSNKGIIQLNQELEKTKELLHQGVEASGLKEVKNAIKDISSVSKSGEISKFAQAFNDGNIDAAGQALDRLKNNLVSFSKGNKDAENEIRAFISSIDESASSSETYKVKLDELKAKLSQFKDKNGNAFNTTNIEKYATQLQPLIENFKKLSTNSDVTSFNSNLEKIQSNIDRIKADMLAETAKNLQDGAQEAHTAGSAINDYTNNVNSAYQAQANLNSEIGQLKNRVQYFFGLTNQVMLLRRALQSTFETVKELDASMTETAVVTDFTVSDMWNQLPQYTATAKEFGVTIKGVYDVMTLYYQQGLDQNTAWQLGTETLKLARIAGLDYAESTDRMTNALRGFNMELNETNAQRVDDVYSKLAAMSASNVDELSIAMTKTASIAKSANMEFEKTAAFLAQIIETTR